MSTPRGVLQDGRITDWFTMENSLIDNHAAEMGVYGFAVYACLCRFAGQGKTCCPSQARIAEMLGISRAQVKREVSKLRSLGLVEVAQRQRDDGDHNTNTYTIT